MMGVFDDNIYNGVNLTGQWLWEVGAGLEQTGPGT
jgi:hypothetical protein